MCSQTYLSTTRSPLGKNLVVANPEYLLSQSLPASSPDQLLVSSDLESKRDQGRLVIGREDAKNLGQKNNY